MDANILLGLGAAGAILGFILLFFFFVRRFSRASQRLAGKKTQSVGIFTSLRNLLLLLVWIVFSTILFFIGFFLRAYHSFSIEKPAAEVQIVSTGEPAMVVVKLTPYRPGTFQPEEQFPVKGQRWALEGEILQWNEWLQFLGLGARYRFTRLQGYEPEAAGHHRSATVHSLTAEDTHPFWRYIYRHGLRMPFVRLTSANIVFPQSAVGKRFDIFVNLAGLSAREKY